VLFEGKGLTAKIEPAKEAAAPAKPAPGKKPAKAEVNTVTFKVTAAPDAELGMREFRVLTPRGASSLGVLVVGEEPEQSEKEPNDTPEQAQPLAPPITMNGRIQAPEDVDCYKIHATAGEEIVFSVISARLEDKIHDLSPGSGGEH